MHPSDHQSHRQGDPATSAQQKLLKLETSRADTQSMNWRKINTLIIALSATQTLAILTLGTIASHAIA
jgi:hypothetical protein